jgi:hypothetical protein
MDMTETVPVAEFARNFGRYKMQAQRESAGVEQRHAGGVFRVATRI